MSLQNLTLAELADLSAHLMTLHAVGANLEEQGLAPVFDLTPGKPVTITVPFTLPAMPEVSAPQRMPQPIELTADLIRTIMADNPAAIDEIHIPTPSSADAPGPADAAPLDAPPAASHAGGAPEPASPSRSEAPAVPPQGADAAEGVADSGGEGGSGSAVRPAAPSGTHQTSFGQTAWTEAEDERLIDLVCLGVHRLGLSKAAAIRSAAHELGRPEAGTAFRCHHKLKDRLTAALAQGDARLDQPEPIPSRDPHDAACQDESPAAETLAEASVPPVGDAPVSEPEPGAGASFAADPVTAHLLTLPEKGGWTVDRDLELMDLSIRNWQPNEIALELQIRADQVKPRFDALTGLYEDATGKKVRRFTRDQVFVALQKLAGKAA